MALYTGAHFRAGHMGILGYKLQTARAVEPHTVADPAFESTGFAVLGPCPYPSWDENNNLGDVESIAAKGQDVGKFAGRRDHVVRTTVDVANGAYFADELNTVVRKRDAAGTAGHYKGLRMTRLAFGCESIYNDEDFTKQPIDCLVNTVGFTYAEGQPVRAAVEWWPTAVVEHPTEGMAATVPPPGDVLLWQHCSMSVNGVDYYPIMARLTVQHSNNLQRIGMRKELWSGGNELRISRTALAVLPGLEKVTFTLELHDELPVPLRGPYNWGSFIIRAEHPNAPYYSTRRYLQIALTKNWTGRIGQPEIAPGQPMTWSSDNSSIGIAITAGTL